ncbi:MAG: hypothetical protein IJM15_03305 [Erysipelotrichaceae bacterium]|nr:hypothetical protein [Erysipelotrichaceae bacterium]
MTIEIISASRLEKPLETEMSFFTEKTDEYLWYHSQIEKARSLPTETADVFLLDRAEPRTSLIRALQIISSETSDDDMNIRLIVPDEPEAYRPPEEFELFPYDYDADVCYEAGFNGAPSAYEPAHILGMVTSDFAITGRKQFKVETTFSDHLFKLIDTKGLRDSDVYKNANIDRRLFSRLRQPDYHPSKNTVLALAIAMKLNIAETDILLEKAGYALSDSLLADQIVSYYIEEQIYDINEINTTLYSYDQKLLGSL